MFSIGKAFSEFKKEEIEQSIPSRFERQVEQYPDREAIETDFHQLTYKQLNKAANSLASAIVAQQGERDELISILFEPGAMMIVAMLGVLKAGKSWVPIDPFYPHARISYILKDSQTSLLVTNSPNILLAEQVLENHKQCQVINIDRIDNNFGEQNLNLLISPDAIACVLYTSGSTGQPKGVVHSHRNLLHLCMRWTNSLYIDAEDRLVLLSSYCHIGGVSNIFRALLNGAVSLPYNLKQRGLGDLGNWLLNEKITLYHSVPTVFRHFIDTLSGNEEFPFLRVIYLGGEPVFKKDVELYRQHFNRDCVFVNNLGCTEISSHRQYFINKSTPITGNIIPVGYAALDTEVVLLGEDGEPVDSDCVGEIAVKSPYLALGYWQRSDLNTAAFLSKPAEKERLYLTGDLGKLLPDGCLIHLGRKDFQVQIRGYRVEIGEIEATLGEHPQLKEVAVRDWNDERGEKFLLAYIVLYPEQVVDSSNLRDFLQQKLPNYMIPSAFIFLDALPLNSNGKIDRLNLPAPDSKSQKSFSIFVPQDKLESHLTKIWSQVLGIQSISVKDNFFDLGGNSLKAVMLFELIEKQFGKRLPLATLFQLATVKEIAQIIRQKEWLAPWDSLVAIQPNGNKFPLFYIHPAGGNLLVYRDLILALGSDQPVYGLQAIGLDGKYAPHNRIEDMATHYLAQIRKVQPNGPYFLAGYSAGGTIAWEIAQRLDTQGQKVALLALIDSSGPKYPNLLPPLPRLLSVLSWIVFDLLSSLSHLPQKLVLKLSQLGIKQTSIKILENLGIIKKTVDEHQKIRGEKVQQEFRVRLATYMSYSNNISSLERWINSLAILLLKYSSLPYYANKFAKAMNRNLSSELPEALQKVQEANYKAKRAYIPQVYSGRVVFFRASQRPPGIHSDPEVGWGGMATGGLEIYEIPGNHTTIIESPMLAEKLKICLNNAQAKQVDRHSVNR